MRALFGDRSRKVQDIVTAHRGRTEAERHKYLGYNIAVEPSVFSPFIAPSGHLSLALLGLPLFEGKRVLDVGCGAGIFACAAAASGAEQVIGIDISKSAVSNAEENAKAVQVRSRTTFIHGDLFDPVEGERAFDIVFADLPFTDGQATDDLEKAFFDSELRSIREFLQGLPKYLGGSDASAFLCWSDLENLEIGPLVRAAGLHAKVFMVVELPWLKLSLLRLQLGN